MQNLLAAIHACVPSPDDRGLLPLEDARRIVGAVQVFEPGPEVSFQGRPCAHLERLWAALLSLDDAEEFVREATRIRWAADAPGGATTAPLERYGEDILPWLESFISPEGWLQNLPSVVGVCLSVQSEPALFELLRKVRGIHRLAEHPAEPPPADGAPGLWDWVGRYPRTGLPLCLKGALDGDERLRRLLVEMVSREPGATFQIVAHGVGAQKARAWFEQLQLPTDGPDPRILAQVAAAPTAEIVSGPRVELRLLDAAFRAGHKPAWDRPDRFTAAMRCTGFASPFGDHLVFQSLETGGDDDGVRVRFHAYGPAFGPQQFQDLSGRSRVLLSDAQLCTVDGPVHEFHLTGVVLTWDEGWRVVRVPWDHPRGEAEISLDGELTTVSLKPIPGLEEQLGPTEVLMMHLPSERAFLRPRSLIEHLALPTDSEPLFEFGTWRHPFGQGAASQSRDLVAMVEALRLRRRIEGLPESLEPLFHLHDRVRTLGGWGTLAAFGRGVEG